MAISCDLHVILLLVMTPEVGNAQYGHCDDLARQALCCDLDLSQTGLCKKMQVTIVCAAICASPDNAGCIYIHQWKLVKNLSFVVLKKKGYR